MTWKKLHFSTPAGTIISGQLKNKKKAKLTKKTRMRDGAKDVTAL